MFSSVLSARRYAISFFSDHNAPHLAATVNCCHEWSRRLCYEAGNPASSFHQELGDIRPCRIFRPNHDDTRSIPYDGCEFSSSIADVLVFRKRDPTSPSNKRDPIFVRRVQRKVIVVYLNLHPRRTKPVCDDVLSKIAIQEEDGLFTLPV